MREARSYPPAPWQLAGTSLQALRLVDSSIAARDVPDGLRVVTVWPGRTPAVLYCASYEASSVLRYHELVFAPAVVAARGRIGFWVSHIYVDDPVSQAGGLGIWGLPKELATFEWQLERREVAVRAGAQPLCRMSWSASRLAVPMPLRLPVISRDASGFRSFGARGSLRVARAQGEIVIETGSPLEGSGFAGPRTLLVGQRLRLRVDAPRRLA